MSKRTEQAAAILLQEFNTVLRREVEFPSGKVVTVTHIDVSEDFHWADVWISVFPPQSWNLVLDRLKAHRNRVQQILAQKMTWHSMPRLRFKRDIQEERVEAFSELLDQIHDESH